MKGTSFIPAKDHSESSGATTTEIYMYNKTMVGRNVYPKNSHREDLLK